MTSEPLESIVPHGPSTGRMSTHPRLASTQLLDEQVGLDSSRSAERSRLLRRLLALGDLLVGVVAGLVAGFVAGAPDADTLGLALLIGLIWPALSFASGLYTLETLRSWATGVPELARVSAMALLLSWPTVGLADALGADHPLIAGLVAAPIAVALGVCSRTVVRATLHRLQPLRQRTLILGSGLVATQLRDRLGHHPEFGLDPIGIVDDEVHQTSDQELRVLGGIDDLRAVLRDHHVERVIIAFSRASHEQILEAMRACREQRVAVDVVPRLFELLNGARALEQIGGLPLLSVGANRLSRFSAAAKRGLDLLVAGTAIPLLAPLMALIAVAIKLESRGPILFRQVRAGRNGERFELLKFRSMYANAEDDKHRLYERNDLDDGVMFKIRRDPRVSRVGRVLRRLSLDELPQLFNVLRGDMSLVGPRPLILSESAALGQSWHARRLDLRPGLTGPWQISGRSDLSVHDMVRLDFQYVTGWSLARDIEILLATVPVVLTGRGAY